MAKIFVGRQPIYDRKMKVYAYEILYRSGQEGGARFTDGDVATSQVLLNTFLEIGVEHIAGSHYAFFNLTQDLLLNVDLDLPRKQVVLEVLENVEIDDRLVAAVTRLHRDGYRIALDDFAFEPHWEPLLKLAHVIKVEVPALDWNQAPQLVRGLKKYKCLLLAEKVETHEEYEKLSKLGFDLFQGYFFCKPKVIEGKRLSTNQLAVVQLLAKINDPNAEVGELEALIRQDAALSYKLLRYLNSPAFGLRRAMDSIRQAITYLGLKPLRSWVTLLAMAGIKDKPSELMKIALVRAKVCEELGIALGHEEPERFFTSGLLSVLDALMDQPMAALLEELPLSDEIKDALLSRKGRVGQVLGWTIAWEQGNWQEAAAFEQGLPNLHNMETLLLGAMEWADETMAGLQG